MKITAILTFSQYRSHSEKNLCEEIENITMDDPGNDMKKTDVKQVKKYFCLFSEYAVYIISYQASLQNLGPTQPNLLCIVNMLF